MHNEVRLWSLGESLRVYLRAEMVFNQGLRGGYIFKRSERDGFQVMLLSDAGFVPLADVLV